MSISHCRARRRLVALAAATTVATLAGLASPGLMAQGAFPSKAITMVVPYPPGGSNDVFARQVAKEMGDLLKQTVIVDNRPGASGNTGTGQVAKATPDGYTLVAISSSMTTNAAIQSKLPFDPVKSFAHVATFAKGPFIVAVNQDVPAKTPAELVALLKKQPGKLNYASSGIGSSNQFATEMLKAATGTFVVHVPYRGMAPAATGLIGGETQLLLASGPSLLPQVRSGRIRAIGITSLKPSAIAPELTPMASAAPGYEFELWWGLLAPAGTPAAIVSQLNAEVNKVLALPEIKAAFLKEGAEAWPQSPAQYTAVVEADIARWKQIAKRQNIAAE